MDDTNVQAHVVPAIQNHWYESNWSAAEAEFKRAIELDPDEASASMPVSLHSNTG